MGRLLNKSNVGDHVNFSQTLVLKKERFKRVIGHRNFGLVRNVLLNRLVTHRRKYPGLNNYVTNTPVML